PARRDRARAVDLSADPARRRTDRQSRHAHRPGNPRADPRSPHPPAVDRRHRDARHERRGELRSHHRVARRPPRPGHPNGRARAQDRDRMILLRLISWPYFRKHVLRTLLTTAGIVLGVAVFVGMHTANQSVLFAFSRTVDRIAGKTELEVTAGETGFEEGVLETVQAAASVRVAVPAIEAVVDTNLTGQGNLLVLGVDMTGDSSLRDYDLDSGEDAVIDDPLVFLAQPDSIILTRQFAETNHLGVNSKISLGTVLGPRQFTVRGIMKAGGLTSAFGGNIAIMDVYAAQK